jgi:AcrR family transcriptional regulator
MPMTKGSYHHGDLKNALIQAGSQILVEEGIGALSLRKVASRAGVSHSAPYAHFSDKQALVAAISTEGFRQLYERLKAAAEANRSDPAGMLVEVAHAYLSFALDSPAFFKVMFSGILEQEKAYPEFVAMSKKNFQLLVELVEQGQKAGVLPMGPPDRTAISIWSIVHGYTALMIDRQIPGSLRASQDLKELLSQVLDQVAMVKKHARSSGQAGMN